MPYTERLMGSAPWSLPLVDDLPPDILDAIRIDEGATTYAPFSSIVVVRQGWSTAGALDHDIGQMFAGTSEANVGSTVRFAGPYLRREGNMLRGESLPWWLGGGENAGPHMDPSLGGFSTDFFGSVLFIQNGGTGDGGFLLDVDYPAAGGPTMAWEPESPVPRVREALDRVCDFFGGEWRMDYTTMELLVDFPANLYPADPTAMFTATGGGPDPVLKAATAKFAPVEHVEDWFSEAVATDGVSFPGSDSKSTVYRWPNGRLMDNWRHQIVDSSATAPDLTTVATQSLALDAMASRTWQLTCSTPDPVDDAGGVGCDVFVYDRANGIYGVNEGRYFRGEWTLPYRSRLVAGTTPFRRGDGIWLRVATTSSYTGLRFYDLAPYVDWASEPTEATIEVGSPLLTALLLRGNRNYSWQA